jgi:GntR family transcriptional repressor for pyruvate dehydrogenase complex
MSIDSRPFLYSYDLDMASNPGDGQRFAPTPINTRGAAQQIADQIRKGIVDGDLKPGFRLPSESELAEDYNVSRGTIRETMKLLAGAQLVRPTRGAAGGTFVRLPDSDAVAASLGETIALWFNAGSASIAEVTTARAWIERGCVILAATQRDEDDLEALRRTVEAMERQTGGIDEMLELDIEFHVAVSRAAHNSVLELAMNAVHLVRPHTNTFFADLLVPEEIAAQHRRIYEAIRDRDPDAASARLDEHLAHLGEITARARDIGRDENALLGDVAAQPHPAADQAWRRVFREDAEPTAPEAGPADG